MRVCIAPDAFKESLDAAAVAAAIARGWRAVRPADALQLIPMADGGEGSAEALRAALGGERRSLRVTGPDGAPREASYVLLDDGETAVIEMASASGLEGLDPAQRQPRLTTSYGSGELIRAALDAGRRRIIMGIGGSATNDGGAGFASALGVRFLDGEGQLLAPGGAALARLATIDYSASTRASPSASRSPAMSTTLAGPGGRLGRLRPAEGRRCRRRRRTRRGPGPLWARARGDPRPPDRRCGGGRRRRRPRRGAAGLL